MKEYLAYWYNHQTEVYKTIHAETLTEAKHKAFRMMCDSAGDRIYSVTVYEKKSTCECQGELNPRPNSAFHEYSGREYLTGRRI